ncbi:WD40 repeat-like protein, partial [Wolfiporia cocos MD-104 SS10]
MPSCLGPIAYPSPSLLRLARTAAISSLMEDGFPYSKRLRGHTSCVNALAFSSGGGRWLASGGDDPYILLWDLHQGETGLNVPSVRLRGHRANIFSVAFSATSQYLYSGATDNTILRFDLGRLSSSPNPRKPEMSIDRHLGSIRDLSCHPEQDEVSLSASGDGRIILHDYRAGSSLSAAQGTLQEQAEFSGVRYHPTMPHIFATSNVLGEICLRDTRMAFGPLSQRKQNGIVHRYVTTIVKSTSLHLYVPEVSSIAFDSTGTKLAATFLNYRPTIYALSDPYPVATCNGSRLPDGSRVPEGERTYSNSCTMKHGSFGGPAMDTDPYYCAGSDDFRTYMWKIPETSLLQTERQVISLDDWISGVHPDTVGFATSMSEPRRVPVELSVPLCRLGGHASIVNTALMHPTLPILATAGIERTVVLHSPTPSCPITTPIYSETSHSHTSSSATPVANPSSRHADGFARTPTAVRALPPATDAARTRAIRAMVSGTVTAADDADSSEDLDDDEESSTLALFDEILRQEGNGDVFTLRRAAHLFAPDSDSEPEADDDSDDNIGATAR